ncbi:hypothetical protein [Methylotenera mobilis]|uniref:Uncharacterized protein n=1 Tax=Methylotenera mobilis (strain JLW8 / ATCC BAA-1282 / DSM 17540) TaxID=583345 RepID=C6WY94_METML|nr:hypothetical protein [Methylotenera mobilis]ACT46990.1 hypothetical protein Mmol_0079 [Methylotenera mobilis JLW8]
MITSALAILLVLFSTLGLLVAVALVVKILRANPEEFNEARRLQGSPINVFNGNLKNSSDECGDFRIVRGLKFDAKNKKYISQSALSSEGLKAVFPH